MNNTKIYNNFKKKQQKGKYVKTAEKQKMTKRKSNSNIENIK